VAEGSGGNVFQELRERKARQLNVVFYGIEEAEGDRLTVEDKKEWDSKSCQNIFDALKLNLKSSTIKYLRRLGEKGNKARPLLAGLRTTEDKALLLDNAKFLRDTFFSNVGISADLTPQEMKEEKEMGVEAERRNKDLSQEDRAKNLKWLLVGPKGEKRLYKGVERTPLVSQRGLRGGRTATGLRLEAQQRQLRGRNYSKRGHSDSDSDGETAQVSNMRKKPHMTAKVPEGREALEEEEEETEEVTETTVEQEVMEIPEREETDEEETNPNPGGGAL